MAKSMMTLKELIESSARVTSKYGKKSYGYSSLSEKSFGTIYYGGKVALYNNEYNVLELRIVFGATRGTTALHVVKMTLLGLDRNKITICESLEKLNEAIDKKYKYKSGKEGPRAKKVKELVSDKHTGIMDTTKLERSIKGIIVPCTDPSVEASDFADYFRPNGKYLYYSGDITLDTRCGVSCSCPSYRYTFAEYNARAGAHSGVEPQYYKSVDKWGFNAPKLNVNRSPGLCKHLMLFATMLAKGEILTGFDEIAPSRSTTNIINDLDKDERGKAVGENDAELRKDLNNLPKVMDLRDTAEAMRRTKNAAKLRSTFDKKIKDKNDAAFNEAIKYFGVERTDEKTKEIYKEYTDVEKIMALNLAKEIAAEMTKETISGGKTKLSERIESIVNSYINYGKKHHKGPGHQGYNR